MSRLGGPCSGAWERESRWLLFPRAPEPQSASQFIRLRASWANPSRALPRLPQPSRNTQCALHISPQALASRPVPAHTALLCFCWPALWLWQILSDNRCKFLFPVSRYCPALIDIPRFPLWVYCAVPSDAFGH